jgi:hypothetical protein
MGFQGGKHSNPIEPVEFSSADLAILNYVMENRLTMASKERVIATINACKHAAKSEVPGDFVECGVWRGGNSIAAKLTLENYGSQKSVWLFDTFAGMTQPSAVDTTSFSEISTAERFARNRGVDRNHWCFSSLEEVRANFRQAGADLSNVRFVVGNVVHTLAEENNLPAEISVLRLDTDFYESTKAELEILYPRLSVGGSLLIDDFGHWHGARLAVEEYLSSLSPRARPLLHFTDYTGRMGVKI